MLVSSIKNYGGKYIVHTQSNCKSLRGGGGGVKNLKRHLFFGGQMKHYSCDADQIPYCVYYIIIARLWAEVFLQ